MHEECMLATSRVCTWSGYYSWWPSVLQHKWNHVLLCGPLFRTSHHGYFRAYKWHSCVTTHFAINILLFPQWPVESVWNQGHHSCAVVWLRDCFLNVKEFWGCPWPVSQSFTPVYHVILWPQPFHSVACIHLEWILKHHWFIASRAMGTQIFRKSRSQLKILCACNMIWSKFSY